MSVAPFARAWIEIQGAITEQIARTVAPFAGAWIEIQNCCKYNSMSFVAPFAGAWIEIECLQDKSCCDGVAPFAGAWIEIGVSDFEMYTVMSLRSPERGLKYIMITLMRVGKLRRSVRRSVD